MSFLRKLYKYLKVRIFFSSFFNASVVGYLSFAQKLLGMPMYFLQFLASPLGKMSVVSNKPKIDLYWQLFLIFIVIFSILIGYYIFNNSFTTVFLFSLAYSLSYLLNLLITYKLAKGNI